MYVELFLKPVVGQLTPPLPITDRARDQGVYKRSEEWELVLKVHDDSGLTAASFGGVAGIFALFFFSDVPKVRKDIMMVRYSSRHQSMQP